MKKSRIFFSILMMIIMSFVFSSCSKDVTYTEKETIVPSIEPSATIFNVGYEQGTTLVDVVSNVVYYANVSKAAKSWLSYAFSDSCKRFNINFSANTDTLPRSGTITLSKGDSAVVLTVNQHSGPKMVHQKVILNLAISPGYFPGISASEIAKIPANDTLAAACSGDGTVTILSAAFATITTGNTSNKIAKFAWTTSLAASCAGGIKVVAPAGFTLSSVYSFHWEWVLVPTKK